MHPRRYRVFPAIFAPSILSLGAVVAGAAISWWFLAALPCIWLGGVCSAPNLNLADGCLAYLTMIFGLVLSFFFEPLGGAIFFGSLCGYYLSVAEKHLRMRPMVEENADDATKTLS